MGGIAQGAGGSAPSGSNQQVIGQMLASATLEARVERLTKLVHILWKEAEKLESIVQVTPGGLRIKAGPSEILVHKDGEVTITGMSIKLRSATKIQLVTGSRTEIFD